MRQVDAMEAMYQEFEDVARFYLVYISEAHAKDDWVPTYSAFKNDIREHETLDERCDVARKLIEHKKLTMPCLVDLMGDDVARRYRAWPDRVFVIDLEGRIAVRARRGPWGFKPGLERAREWLTRWRERGGDPARDRR